MSESPPHAPSALPPVGADRPRRVRVHHLRAAKAAGERLTMLTAYDAVTARIFDAAGIDLLLVGDSIGDNKIGRASCRERVEIAMVGGSVNTKQQEGVVVGNCEEENALQ